MGEWSTQSSISLIADLYPAIVLYAFPASSWSVKNSTILFKDSTTGFSCLSVHQYSHFLMFDDTILVELLSNTAS